MSLCVSVFLSSNLRLSFSGCRCSQMTWFLSVTLPVHCPYFHMFCEMRHYNGWTIFFQSRVHFSLVALVQLWSRPKAAQKCCHHTSGERQKERMWRKDRLGRISQNNLLFSWGYVVTYFSNASFLPGCARLRADTYSGRHEWARIQFCTWVVSKQVKRKLWIFTEISQT